MAYHVIFMRAKSSCLLWAMSENKYDLQKTFWHACDLLLSLLSGQNDANLQKVTFLNNSFIHSEFNKFLELKHELTHN